METFDFRLVYDGLGAAEHKMPTSLEKQITIGAQEFLGAHAYFLTEGQIPTNVHDRSRYFHIHDIRRRRGSWEATFAIEIANVASEFTSAYLHELTNNLAGKAASLTQLYFLYLIHCSYRAWRERRPMREQAFDRVEPVLTESVGNRAPIFDVETEYESRRRRLFERTNASMSKITAPIGRASTHLDIYLNTDRLDRIEQRFISEEDVAAAILPLRAKLENRRSL